MSEIGDKLRELRFARMRLGQAIGEIVQPLSQPEVDFAIVPLTEAEYYQCVEVITGMDAPDNIVGAAKRDARNRSEVLFRALRHPENLEEKAFDSREEMTEVLEAGDINHLLDLYWETAETDNPWPGEFSEQETEDIKKVLEEVDLNALSGRQCYALRRFLSRLGYELLPDNSPGYISTNSSITMSDEEKSIHIAD